MGNDNEVTWVKLKDVCKQFGYTYGSAKQLNQKGKFPVKVFSMGNTLVCDKETVTLYFERMRAESLRALNDARDC